MAKKSEKKVAKASKASSKSVQPSGAKTKLTRSAKVLKKIARCEKKAPKQSKLIQTVTVSRMGEAVYPGYIVEQDDKNQVVLFRRKKTSASSAMGQARFPYNKIVELFGSVGKPSEITVIERQEIQKVSGVVTQKGDMLYITDGNGEPTMINTALPGYEVEVFGLEEQSKKK